MLDSEKNYQVILELVGKTLVKNRTASYHETLTTYEGKNSALTRRRKPADTTGGQ